MPLLVSPALLRERGLGQIDIARLKKHNANWKIEITEVKSSKLGEDVYLRKQQYRIKTALTFLIGIFGFSGATLVAKKEVE